MGRLDRGEDVQAAVAGGLDERVEPGLGEHRRAARGAAGTASCEVACPAAGRGRCAAGPGCRCRPARDAHGWNTMVFICAAQTAAAGLVDDELRMPPAARVGAPSPQRRSPARPWRVLREELLAVDPLREPLQRHRPVAVGRDERRRHRDEVLRELELGDAGLRPEHAVGLEIRTSRSPCGPGTVSVIGRTPCRQPRHGEPRRFLDPVFTRLCLAFASVCTG